MLIHVMVTWQKYRTVYFFNWAERQQSGEGSGTELKLGMEQIPFASGEPNGGKIFWMCATFNIAIYAMEMIKLEVNGKLVELQQGSFQLFNAKEDFYINSPSIF